MFNTLQGKPQTSKVVSNSMGTCHDLSNMFVSGMGLLFEMNNEIEQKGFKIMTKFD